MSWPNYTDTCFGWNFSRRIWKFYIYLTCSFFIQTTQDWQCRLLIGPLYQMTQKNLEKSHVGGQVMTRRFQLSLNFFSETEGSRIPKIFLRNNFRPFWTRWAYFWKVSRTFFFWGVPFDWTLPIFSNLREKQKKYSVKPDTRIKFYLIRWEKFSSVKTDGTLYRIRSISGMLTRNGHRDWCLPI